MHKCQRCQSPATLHITEIVGPTHIEEVHLCEQCATKYAQEGPVKAGAAKGAKELTADDVRILSGQTEAIIAKDQAYLTELAAAVRGRLARQPAREAESVAN